LLEIIDEEVWYIDYDPREEKANALNNEEEIRQKQLFIQTLQDELTITKIEAKKIKIEKLKADATILQLTKQLASLDIHVIIIIN
jgi:hypothetical protein